MTAGSHQGCMAAEVGKGFGLRVPWCTAVGANGSEYNGASQ